jgi:pimeloyl-ACP methyl ester carboxylesterase
MSMPRDFETLAVRTPDGLTINAQTWGNPKGRPIVFIHGFMQSHLSWLHQTRSALAQEFRLVTYDVRGHGASDKPFEAAVYQESHRFADELQVVMEAAGVKRPVLVGWSYGTRIIGDYLVRFGGDGLAGLNLVGSAVSDRPEHFGPGRAAMHEATTSDDYATAIGGTRRFLRACFERQPPQDDFETMLAFNAQVPVPIRRWLRRPGAAAYEEAFRKLERPVLITHGVLDKLPSIELAKWLATLMPAAKTSFYDGIGHAPFLEAPDRFNVELAAFVRSAPEGRAMPRRPTRKAQGRRAQ